MLCLHLEYRFCFSPKKVLKVLPQCKAAFNQRSNQRKQNGRLKILYLFQINDGTISCNTSLNSPHNMGSICFDISNHQDEEENVTADIAHCKGNNKNYLNLSIDRFPQKHFSLHISFLYVNFSIDTRCIMDWKCNTFYNYITGSTRSHDLWKHYQVESKQLFAMITVPLAGLYRNLLPIRAFIYWVLKQVTHCKQPEV